MNHSWVIHQRAYTERAELELKLIQSHMTQKPVLRGEVRVKAYLPNHCLFLHLQLRMQRKQGTSNSRPRMKRWAMAPQIPGHLSKKMPPQLGLKTRQLAPWTKRCTAARKKTDHPRQRAPKGTATAPSKTNGGTHKKMPKALLFFKHTEKGH